jgi:hypothetical protein
VRALENRALYAIQYGSGDIWMNERGDLGSLTLCKVFDGEEEASTFLGSRKLRRGFRPRLAVRPLTTADLRTMVESAEECLDSATAHGGDTGLWRNRIELLRAYLPLTTAEAA